VSNWTKVSKFANLEFGWTVRGGAGERYMSVHDVIFSISVILMITTSKSVYVHPEKLK